MPKNALTHEMLSAHREAILVHVMFVYNFLKNFWITLAAEKHWFACKQ